MISAQLTGGLGNMMFQIAAMESLGKDYNLDVNYPNADTHLQNMNLFERTSTYDALAYKHIFENFHWTCVSVRSLSGVIEVPFAYVKLEPKDGDYYKGYFQSEKFFAHNREFILNLFQPTEEVKGKLNKYDFITSEHNTCSIHVRRGDYLRYTNTHFVQGIDYFQRAVKEIDVKKYIIFSDDIDWCKNNFIDNPCFKGKRLIFIENEKDYVELFLMSKCTSHIVSNSSFSWWGAWLGTNDNKKVVAPLRWWSGYCDDVVPEKWIKL